MPEAQTKLTLTLDPDGKISIRSEGQFANDRTVLVWLLRQAETVILEGAVEAAFRSCRPDCPGQDDAARSGIAAEVKRA